MCKIFFEMVALESLLGAEMTFYGHWRSLEMARLEREYTTSC